MMIEIPIEELKIGDYVTLGECNESTSPVGKILENCGIFKVQSLCPRYVYVDPTKKQVEVISKEGYEPYSSRFRSRIKKVFREIPDQDEAIII